MDDRFFDEITERIRAVLAQGPATDIEKNVRAALAAGFARLDLVTREEFDVQAEVLSRARAQLRELESRLAELERKRGPAPDC